MHGTALPYSETLSQPFHPVKTKHSFLDSSCYTQVNLFRVEQVAFPETGKQC